MGTVFKSYLNKLAIRCLLCYGLMLIWCCTCSKANTPTFTLTIQTESSDATSEAIRLPLIALDLKNTGKHTAHMSRESLNQGMILEIRTANGNLVPLKNRGEELKKILETNPYHGGEDIKGGHSLTFIVGLGDFAKLPPKTTLTLRIRWTLKTTQVYGKDELPKEGTEEQVTLTSNILSFATEDTR